MNLYQQALARRAALERLALEYALSPGPSGDGACVAFDRECDEIEREIAAIDAWLAQPEPRAPWETQP